MNKLLLVGFVLYVLGTAVASIGDPVICKPGEVVEARTVMLIALLMIIPAVLGYLAGRDDE
mgnify:CR=1 FL=1